MLKKVKKLVEEQRRRFAHDKTVQYILTRDNGESLIFTSATDAGKAKKSILRATNHGNPKIKQFDLINQYDGNGEYVGSYVYDESVIERKEGKK